MAVGAGLQTKVAVLNLICFYVIGVPIGVVLGYVFNLQVKVIRLSNIRERPEYNKLMFRQLTGYMAGTNERSRDSDTCTWLHDLENKLGRRGKNDT